MRIEELKPFHTVQTRHYVSPSAVIFLHLPTGQEHGMIRMYSMYVQ